MLVAAHMSMTRLSMSIVVSWRDGQGPGRKKRSRRWT